jgi:DNA-binding SARP family transcriptional activator
MMITDHTTARTVTIGAEPPVQISLLGGFELMIGGRDAAKSIGRRDASRLAKFLALAPQRRAHREQIIDALWPDAPFETAPNRLHKAAHFLRAATGVADSVMLSGAIVALLPDVPVETDIAAFERHARNGLARGDLRLIDQAITIYRGDLLPHDPYEQWLENDRERLRGRFRHVLRAGGRFERLVAVDPTDEEGHLGMMRAMMRAGDRSGVLRQYDWLRRVLEEQLGVDPGPEARSLRDLALAPVRSETDRFLPALHVTGHGRPGGRRHSQVAVAAQHCLSRHRPVAASG